MKQLVVFIVIATMINASECKAQGKQKLAMTAVMTSIYAGKDDASIPGDDIASINSKAINHFNKKYRKARNVKWMILSDGFLARFNDEHSLQRIFYYTNGIIAGSLKGYDAAYLPKEINQTVKEKYSGYKVAYVNEAELAHLDSSPTFILQLKGKNDIKVVRICDDFSEDITTSMQQSSNPVRF